MPALDRLLSGCVIAAALLLTAGQSLGQSRVPPRPELRGVVRKVDPAAGTITLNVLGGREEAQEKTYALAETVEVAINNGVGFRGPFAEGKLDDLAVGTLVSFILS